MIMIRKNILALVAMAVTLASCCSDYEPFSNGSDAGRAALANPTVGVDDSQTTPNALCFRWNKVAGANEYSVVVTDNNGAVCHETSTADTFFVSHDYIPETEYTATVTAYSPIEGKETALASSTVVYTGKTTKFNIEATVNGLVTTVNFKDFDSSANAFNVSVFDADGKELKNEVCTGSEYVFTAPDKGTYSVKANGYYVGYYVRNDVEYYTSYTSLSGYANNPQPEFVITSTISYPFDVNGTIYLLGKGNYVSGTLHAEKADDGTVNYSIKEWYGSGSKTLKFTLGSDGQMSIASNVLQYDGSYSYYWTGLPDSDVNLLCGYKGYDTSGVYDKDALDKQGKWQGIGVINPKNGFYIYIRGYYGPYSYTPYAPITDPNGYRYWTFEYPEVTE